MIEYKNKYNVFSLGSVGIYNQYHILAYENIIDIPEYNDIGRDEYRSKKWGRVREEFEKHSLEENNLFIKNTIIEKKVDYVQSILKRFYFASYDSNFNNIIWLQIPGLSIIVNAFFNFFFRINFVYFFILVYSILLIYSLKRYKKIPFAGLFIYLFVMINLFTAVVGAQDDWGRLFVPFYPLVLLLISQSVSKLSFKLKYLESNF